MFPIKICFTLNKWWYFGFNKGWYYNEYRDNRFESCGFITIYMFKRAVNILWSYKWYSWWLSTRDQEFNKVRNDVLYPFGVGYPK